MPVSARPDRPCTEGFRSFKSLSLSYKEWTCLPNRTRRRERRRGSLPRATGEKTPRGNCSRGWPGRKRPQRRWRRGVCRKSNCRRSAHNGLRSLFAPDLTTGPVARVCAANLLARQSGWEIGHGQPGLEGLAKRRSGATSLAPMSTLSIF